MDSEKSRVDEMYNATCIHCGDTTDIQMWPHRNGHGMMVGQTDYGIPFTSAVAQDNIFAIQCHPEKSARSGLVLLENFIQWKP